MTDYEIINEQLFRTTRKWVTNLTNADREHLHDMGCTDYEIDRLITQDEAFQLLLEWNGILGFDRRIKQMVQRIYNKKL